MWRVWSSVCGGRYIAVRSIMQVCGAVCSTTCSFSSAPFSKQAHTPASKKVATMLAKAILGPLYLPVLQLVTLLMTPATAIYAIGGLLASPVLVPAIIIKNLVVLAIFAPFLLLTLPVAIPAGFVLASLLVGGCILKSFCVVLTPLLWPLWFLCAWCKATCIVSQVIVTDTIMPWLVPIRFTFLAALAPTLLLGP